MKDNVVNKFFSKIEDLEKQGKIHDSIVEIYKMSEYYSVDEINKILKQSSNKNFCLSIFIAFLTATLPMKNELSNRNLVFNKTKKIATLELGDDKLNKSIFNNLK